VLGSGLERISPLRNLPLARDILRTGGTILSEYPPLTEPLPHHFPIRNRIIAGLTLGTIVVEAPSRSGALITAREALEANREVFGVPHDATRPQGEGVNALISRGAHLVRSGEDILRILDPDAPLTLPIRFEERGANDLERRLLEALRSGTTSLDDLVEYCGEPPNRTLATVELLEMRGIIRNLGGQRYVLLGSSHQRTNKRDAI